jgi:hypothetical protein
MDGVLLEVRNWKERYRAWSLVAMTSHVWTLSMLLFQDSNGTSVALFIQILIIWPSIVVMSSIPNQVHSLLLAYYRAMSLWLHKKVSGMRPFLLAM